MVSWNACSFRCNQFIESYELLEKNIIVVRLHSRLREKTLGHLVIDDPESLLLLVYVLMQSWSVAWVHPKGIRGIREHHCSTRR